MRASGETARELLHSRVRSARDDPGVSGALAAFGGQAGGYGSRRQELLLSLQDSSRRTVEAYDPQRSAERLVAAVRTSLAQAALLQLGAVGVSYAVAVKTTTLMDLTGLLPAALLAVTGLAVLPMQRHRLQRELA